jgi:hypothetical protein
MRTVRGSPIIEYKYNRKRGKYRLFKKLEEKIRKENKLIEKSANAWKKYFTIKK